MPTINDATGLPGAHECRYFGSYSGAVKVLRAGLVAIAASDNGSISFWRRSDTGKLRGGFYRFQSTLDERDFANLKELRQWLAKWYPIMDEPRSAR